MSREQSQIDPIDINREIASNNFENNAMPNDKVRLFMYPIKSLFGNKNKDEILTYSPNVVNVKIIDPDDYQEFTGTIQQNQSYKYGTKQAIASADNEIAVVQNLATNYVTEDYVTYDKKKLYLISENKLETDDDIYFYGKIVQEFNTNQGSNNYDDDDFYDEVPQYNLLVTQDINGWTPKDANDLILRIGKQVDNFELTELEIETPKAFLLEGLKVLARDEDNVLGYADVISKKPIYPLWVNPIEITSSGKMRLLNFWMSDRLLNYEIANKINGENTEEILGKLLNFKNDDIHPSSKRRIYGVKNVELKLKNWKYDWSLLGSGGDWTPWLEKEITNSLNVFRASQDKESLFLYQEESGVTPESRNNYVSEGGIPEKGTTISKKMKNVRISNIDIFYETDESIILSSLYELLLDSLSATYNYNFNFKGAGYKDKKTGELNEMAIYKQRFEGKTIAEYIDSLEKTWETNNPKYIDSIQYQNYKKIKTMLSGYLFGSNSIANNVKDDCHFLLPYYFDIINKPIYENKEGNTIIDVNSGDGIWKFKNISLTFKTMYFEEKNNFINLSNKYILSGINDSFIWQNLPEMIDESKLPSLRNSDLKVSDTNVTKFLVYSSTDIVNDYGSNKKIIFSKNDFKNVLKNNKFELLIKNNYYNPKFIEITGIYGAGNYNITLISNNNKIKINNISLFKGDKENQGLIKISL